MNFRIEFSRYVCKGGGLHISVQHELEANNAQENEYAQDKPSRYRSWIAGFPRALRRNVTVHSEDPSRHSDKDQKRLKQMCDSRNSVRVYVHAFLLVFSGLSDSKTLGHKKDNFAELLARCEIFVGEAALG